ncbi:hypothetical protein OF83DRAFT_62676 [Amylostereum chailletii]|nr:hypothetical protein OF83DRAFT_62676 [Amylostereum chailletii]
MFPWYLRSFLGRTACERTRLLLRSEIRTPISLLSEDWKSSGQPEDSPEPFLLLRWCGTGRTAGPPPPSKYDTHPSPFADASLRSRFPFRPNTLFDRAPRRTRGAYFPDASLAELSSSTLTSTSTRAFASFAFVGASARSIAPPHRYLLTYDSIRTSARNVKENRTNRRPNMSPPTRSRVGVPASLGRLLPFAIPYRSLTPSHTPHPPPRATQQKSQFPRPTHRRRRDRTRTRYYGGGDAEVLTFDRTEQNTLAAEPWRAAPILHRDRARVCHGLSGGGRPLSCLCSSKLRLPRAVHGRSDADAIYV